MKEFGVTVLRWVGGLVGFALAVGLGLATVLYVHVNWQALEVPAAFLFLILGVTLGVAALRMRSSLTEKTVGVTSLACFGLSAGIAIFHGWGVEVRAIYNAAAILFVLASLAFSGWLIFRLSRIMRHSAGAAPIPTHLGEPSERAILADAAEPYILYPAKQKIARALLILLAITVLFGATTFWVFTTYHDTTAVLVGALLLLFVALCGLACLALSYRLVAHKPALIVTHRGLIDRASGIFDGAGPIRWEEVNHATILSKSDTLRPTLRYLAIIPENARSFMRRRSTLGLVLLKLLSPSLLVGMAIYLPEFMLPVPLEEVIEQIQRFAPRAVGLTDAGNAPSAVDRASGG